MTFRLRISAAILLGAVILLFAGTASASGEILLGDADGDTKITILDATCIQRTLAGLPVDGNFSKLAADVDGSGEIEITDATYIQRWLVNLKPPYPIGEAIDAPTEPPSERPTDEEGWGLDIFRP